MISGRNFGSMTRPFILQIFLDDEREKNIFWLKYIGKLVLNSRISESDDSLVHLGNLSSPDNSDFELESEEKVEVIDHNIEHQFAFADVNDSTWPVSDGDGIETTEL